MFSEETYTHALTKTASLFHSRDSSRNQNWTLRSTNFPTIKTVDVNQIQAGLIQLSNNGSQAEVN